MPEHNIHGASNHMQAFLRAPYIQSGNIPSLHWVEVRLSKLKPSSPYVCWLQSVRLTHFPTVFSESCSNSIMSLTPSSRSVTRLSIVTPLPFNWSLHQLVNVFCWISIQVQDMSATAILRPPPAKSREEDIEEEKVLYACEWNVQVCSLCNVSVTVW